MKTSRLHHSGPRFTRLLVFIGITIFCASPLIAQGNYEIQVYGSDTVPARNTMLELHSNFTPDGQTQTIDGIYPTNHHFHETIEITQGINNWSEVGFYIFTSAQSGHGVQWGAGPASVLASAYLTPGTGPSA